MHLFLNPTSGWTVQLLKIAGCAKSIWVPTITPMGDETTPPRTQCDLGHWILPRHVIDGNILSPQASLLRLKGVAKAILCPTCLMTPTWKGWICIHLMHPYPISPDDYLFPKGLSIHWTYRFLQAYPMGLLDTLRQTLS